MQPAIFLLSHLVVVCAFVCDRDRGSFFDKRSRGLLQYERPYLLAVEDPKDGENDLGRNSWNASRVRQVMPDAQLLRGMSWSTEHGFGVVVYRVLSSRSLQRLSWSSVSTNAVDAVEPLKDGENGLGCKSWNASRVRHVIRDAGLLWGFWQSSFKSLASGGNICSIRLA